MAKVRIEYVRTGDDRVGSPHALVYQLLGSEGAPLTTSETATSSGSRPVVPAFDGEAYTWVLLTAIGGAVYCEPGEDPTADGTGACIRLPEDLPVPIRVRAGHKLSFIDLTE